MKVDAHFSKRDKLDVLQEICNNLLGECGDSVSACKRLLDGVFVNIFDYVEGNYKDVFDSKKALLKRCKKVGFYPKERAKEENLRSLLVFFFPPN
eukprot:CAMPEP_0174270950 /NCGR_PEP_ID=MMETSP0439-20130205/46344_1 /TAXON_ID=0 /ORGANISM="Stereomyxa ramosa, Strain Chinc5" /LENGTH=94 /DNA_ID=CAMNT_0015360647 /DNA_START=391 /DNA_END=675 /DNA_ORIENTATION=-